MIDIIALQKEDLNRLTALIKLYEDVFEMENFIMPDNAYLQSLLERNGTTFLVATIDGVVVGGLTAHDLPSTYCETNEVYVYDLAVAKVHQRKGIGKTLLSALAGICQKKSEKEFFLQADIDDLDAIDFYRSTGGVEEAVIHFSYDTTA